MSSIATVPRSIATLVERFDGEAFDARGPVRIRIALGEGEAWDVLVADGSAVIGPPGSRPDALLAGDAKAWREIAADVRAGMRAFRSGRLSVRRNVHLGIGFLAATSGATGPGRLRFRTVASAGARCSLVEAGVGPTAVALHGLGATKASFLTTVAALSGQFRVIALDLPGFGDSDKPIGAAYDAQYFAEAVLGVLDALELKRVHLIGNSLGGRVALEVALRQPRRVSRLALLAPSLAWRRERPARLLVRLSRPELGLVQLAPRPVVKGIVERLVPGADEGWTAAGVDEFLRAYLTRSGRAAFYAAARHIYLEEPHGKDGFWTRLRALRADALFVWGRRDRLVPIAFERHVADALPRARHLELDCGHVPQVERPRETHAALAGFLSGSSGRTLVARRALRAERAARLSARADAARAS
ncbi:MAG TPA: alpha/beta fold hydrolase [Solirubrobacteraceae bacterium]|nr:alpha/beta fold hydrolase [Solirubrobacteraceae bacterium]